MRLHQRVFIIISAILFFTCTGCNKQSGQEGIAVPKEDCQITFFDTGKSDCILIEVDDMVIMNDTADEDDYALIQKTLNDKQISRIDYMIISHFDKDHIGSAAKLIEQNEVGCVLMPGYWEDSDEYRAMIDAIQAKGIEKKVPESDFELTTADGIIEINVPQESIYEDDNNYSLITTVTYKGHSVLLMGDALKNRTEEFMTAVSPTEGQYDLIKTPHHGDYNKKLKNLFGTVKPQYAVITDSSDEKRVEEKLVSMLEEEQCEILYTYNGTITVVLDNAGVHVKQ